MTIAFYLAGAVALAATIMVITRTNAVHALLYLVLSLLAVALVFFALGAPFIAALEVMVYAGAIMVLFIFVIMMLNLGPAGVARERAWLPARVFIGPAILAAVLLIDLLVLLKYGAAPMPPTARAVIAPKAVSLALFGPYLLTIELASFVLLAGLVGAYHLGRREKKDGSDG
jgi:NADH-quinone oxidoreductase subunit J